MYRLKKPARKLLEEGGFLILVDKNCQGTLYFKERGKIKRAGWDGVYADIGLRIITARSKEFEKYVWEERER